ncbi:NDP-hexose 2,3-dehydratase, partial [Streptomyces sp. SID11233]|nr:NDP-hexose 2,3-dehydratase [Streptomyces sp. SID11233]
LQSERSAWFLRKRNRHLVVESTADIPSGGDFCWLTLGQLRRLMSRDHLLSMETCSVLACLPERAPEEGEAGHRQSRFRAALLKSLDEQAASRHRLPEVISRLTAVKALHEVGQRTVPLSEVAGWQRLDEEISRPDGRYFAVVGAEVTARSREVAHWTQPLLAPVPGGLSALFTRSIDGVLHVLLEARVEAGSLDVAEFRPTVQCTPSNHEGRPGWPRPHFLDAALAMPGDRVRCEVRMCEEGARFLDAENRYLVIDVGEDFPLDVPPAFTWVTVAQVQRLLEHSYYLNMQARTLIALLHALH